MPSKKIQVSGRAPAIEIGNLSAGRFFKDRDQTICCRLDEGRGDSVYYYKLGSKSTSVCDRDKMVHPVNNVEVSYDE